MGLRTESEATPTTAIQVSWHDAALYLWGLDARRADRGPALAHVVDLIRTVDRTLGRDVASLAMPTRVRLPLPGRLGSAPVPALRMPLSGLPTISTSPTSTASVRWFATVAELAERTVDAARVRPELHVAGAVHVARWTSVAEPALDAALEQLTAQMPAACLVEDVRSFFETVVDSCARRRLVDEAWRPPPPLRARGPEYRAAQATFRALASASGSVLYRTEDTPALADLRRTFQHLNDRARGLPVVAAQLRLHLPDDADDPWVITLELVDADEPARGCTARDAADRTPLALDLAREHAHLDGLEARVADAGRRLAFRIEQLAPLGTDPTAPIELTIDEIEAFLTEVPPVLDELGVRLLGPEQLVRARAGVRGAATPRDAPSSGRFSASALVQWDATVDDTPVDEAQLERAASAGSSLLHVNGRWIRLDERQVRTTLSRLQKHREEHSELDIGELVRLAAENADPLTRIGGDQWISDLLAGLPDDKLTETHEPPGFVGELRHYQRRGLSWMSFLGRVGLGGCLADDMGLGKTATALAHLATRSREMRPRKPHLVVCPLSVVHNWYAEAARFTPDLEVEIHHGGERARGTQAAAQLVPSDVVVTTYGLLARDIDSLGEVEWGTVILDEAQMVKNHATRAAKAVRRLSAEQKLALTGTPVENHLGELWSILDAVNPGLYGSAKSFSEKYAKPIQRNGDAAATAALRTLTQPFVLRRTKADKTLLPELPDKIEKIAWSALTREQATMYQAVVDDLLANAQAAEGMKRRGLVLAALTRLKQICNHPAQAAGDGSRIEGRSGKLARFDELVDELLEVGERALVFTQFREMGLILQRHLADRLRMDAPFLHGGVARAGREKMVRRFQDDEGAPLLLVSLKAGGTGLNLTAASQVIHYDRWWNPAVEDQATDRAWRLGQAHTVLVHKLVCEGTLEERIAQLIDDKRGLAASVLGTGEQWLTELSTDELRSLVSLTPSSVQGVGR
jgi:superfamily II DNA or RNA helicase